MAPVTPGMATLFYRSVKACIVAVVSAETVIPESTKVSANYLKVSSVDLLNIPHPILVTPSTVPSRFGLTGSAVSSKT